MLVQVVPPSFSGRHRTPPKTPAPLRVGRAAVDRIAGIPRPSARVYSACRSSSDLAVSVTDRCGPLFAESVLHADKVTGKVEQVDTAIDDLSPVHHRAVESPLRDTAITTDQRRGVAVVRVRIGLQKCRNASTNLTDPSKRGAVVVRADRREVRAIGREEAHDS